jgi:poly-gamma-glutamate system protein
MYRPSRRSIWTLIFLAVASFALFQIVEHRRVPYLKPWYPQKLQASRLAARGLEALREERLQQEIFGRDYEDPRLAAVIGQQFSLITTDDGVFDAKVAGANPNFAAVAVDLLKQANLKEGDYVAIGCTGSYPGVNLAVYTACEVLKLRPLVITSVGSSWWGANDPDFTWLDMEAVLERRGVTHCHSLAASMGGDKDNAKGLSQIGKGILKSAAERNGIPFISEPTLEGSIQKRIEVYERAAAGSPIKAYINIGGGLASLGHSENGNLIPTGFNQHLPLKNYPARGVIHYFASRGIPAIHFYEILELAKKYGLGPTRVQLPDVGTGAVFVEERYDLRLAGGGAAIVFLLLLIVIKLDSHLFRFKEEGVDPDTLM